MLSAASALEYLVNMLPAILMRGLQIMQLFVQVLDICLELGRLRLQSLVNLCRRAEDKPIPCCISDCISLSRSRDPKSRWSSDPLGMAAGVKCAAIGELALGLLTYILPTPS